MITFLIALLFLFVMDEEYLLRRSLVSVFAKELKQYLEGVLLVGPLAYGFSSASRRAPIEVVGIANFSSMDYEGVVSCLGVSVDEVVAREVSFVRVNMVDVVSSFHTVPVCLHLWDVSAFDRVSGCDDGVPNKFFSVGECVLPVLRSLSGDEKCFGVYESMPFGRRYWVYPFLTDKGLYVGEQARLLLSGPELLWDPACRVSRQIAAFYAHFQRLLRSRYLVSGVDVSLLNVFSAEEKKVFPEGLVRSLDDFF